jgi:16S rRNA processing protein RimM
MADELILIGRTAKTHGTAGEIKVFIEDRYLDDFAETDVVFINIQGKPAPFFIEELRAAGDLLLKLEEIDTPAQAKAITSSDIFLRKQDMRTQPDSPADTSFKVYEGFEIADENLGTIGRIIEVIEFPHQEMAVVGYQGGEVMIPLHHSLVKKIDHPARILFLDLPDGILDL